MLYATKKSYILKNDFMVRDNKNTDESGPWMRFKKIQSKKVMILLETITFVSAEAPGA